MNKQKLLNSLHYRVRLWPVPWRRTPAGEWLPPIDHDWLVSQVDLSGIVQLMSNRTWHTATLGPDRIHHFEHEPHRDWDGLKHGLFVLHTQLVISGVNVFYLPHQRLRTH